MDGEQYTPSQSALKYADCNLVFVSFDALQAARLGSLGYPRNITPTIDSVARQSFSFTHAYSVASWTVPASMTWFTGVFPSEHRMTNKFAVYAPPVRKPANLKALAPQLTTLADLMKRNGYATGGFTGNAGVSGGFGYEQGFDVYYHERDVFGGFDQSMPKALDWIAANRDRKFFVFLHGYDAHGQNTPASGFDYRFVEKGYDKRFTGSEQQQEALREEGLERRRLNLREADLRFWRAIYDEKIERADARFADFLAKFDRLGLTNKTLFVITSDHGTEFCEHGRFDHGFTLYDEQIHVPLVIRLPGQIQGQRVSDRISSIDVMPTLLDLLAIPITDDIHRQLRGTSLVPTFRGESARRDIISESDYRLYTFQRSLISPEGWKLICTMENGKRELYDLNSDPGEIDNRFDAEPKIAKELERRLFEHFRSIGHDLTKRRWETGLNPVYRSQDRP